MTGSALLFYVFGALALASAVLVVTGKNAIASAVYLVVAFFNLAGLYVLLEAHFLAASQILVYAGAITVLILFVIMLLDVSQLVRLQGSRNAIARSLGIVLAGLFAILLASQLAPGEVGFPEKLPEGFGTVESIGDLLFDRYLLAFELVSVLLLAAIVAAVAIAHREGESTP
ncbi:MAG: NADH-quinone oxidoreductase subunit J [Bdellovibrionota bacterium]